MTIVALYKWTYNPQDAQVGDDGTVDWSTAKPAISEYDTIAVEIARQVADATSSECVGVSVGTSEVNSGVARKSVMSRGLDWAMVAAADETAEWNATDVARALAAMVRRVEGADLVLAGDVSVDEGVGIVPALTAGYLGWPCLTGVAGLERFAGGWTVQQVVAGGTRTIQVEGPLVAAVTTDAAKPRVPGVKDILAAGKKRVDVIGVDELPAAISKVTVAGRQKPAEVGRRHITFTGDSAVADLVSALRADGLV
jgi:electron transfer flavoprotein beta subunit